MSGEKRLSDPRLSASLSRLGLSARGRTSSGSSLTRLNSLKPARDLTLGSTPKRTFVPNLSARRLVKDEPSSENSEASSSAEKSGKRNRDRDRGKPRGRGRGRGELITSQSIFSQGPFAVGRSVGEAVASTSQSSNRDSGYRESRSRASIIASGGHGEFENGEDSQRILSMLDDSGTIGMDTDEMQTGGLMPITVPLADPKLYDLKLKGHAQEKTSFATTAVNSEVKFEQTDDIEMSDLDEHPPRSVAKNSRQLTCDQLFSCYNAEEEKLLFLQFPDTLPIKPLSHDSDVPGDIQENQDSTSTATDENLQKFSLKNVSEGYIGKLVVHKSGRVRMLLGNASLDVEMGTPCGFLQDLMAINLDDDRREMVCLGHVDHKIICVPDYEQLIGNAAS